MAEYNEFELIDTLNMLGLSHKSNGKEIQLENCPYCEQGRKKKSDHFSFEKATGVFHCVKCEARGNLWTFKRDQGLDLGAKAYRKLDQNVVSSYTKQPNSYFDGYHQARGIASSILKKYEVGYFYHEKLGVCRTYVYHNESGEIVNVKYVNKNKQMSTEYNCQKPYFGTKHVNPELGFLNVTEGEDDCMALAQLGFQNVVSVPFGAGNYSEEIGKFNAQFKKIYLFFDNDPVGQKGAERFAQKAGIWKCENVVLPFKDARDCLRHGLQKDDIGEYISRAHKFKYSDEIKHRPALSVSERHERLKASYELGPGVKFGYEALDALTGGIRPGEVLTLLANPGAYKTTLAMNMMLRYAERLESGIVIFFSLEMPIESEFERELKISTNRSVREIKSMLNCGSLSHGIASERIYVSEEAYTDLEGITEIIRNTEDATGEKCMFTVVDYLDFVMAPGKEYEQVKTIMNGLKTKIARKLSIPTCILCQTHRDGCKTGQEVSLRDGKGGTAIEAASDFVIGLWNKDGLRGRCLKHRRIDDEYNGVPWPYLAFELNARMFRISNVVVKDGGWEKEEDGEF